MSGSRGGSGGPDPPQKKLNQITVASPPRIMFLDPRMQKKHVIPPCPNLDFQEFYKYCKGYPKHKLKGIHVVVIFIYILTLYVWFLFNNVVLDFLATDKTNPFDPFGKYKKRKKEIYNPFFFRCAFP